MLAKDATASAAPAGEAAIFDMLFVPSHCRRYACRLFASDRLARQQESMHDSGTANLLY
jgi:hypothetical protein